MSEVTQWRRDALICFCLAAVTLAVYWPLRHAEFTCYDDDVYVTGNPRVQGGLTPAGIVWAFTTCDASNWHPLTWLSHMLDCQLFGLKAGTHHLVNVLLHIANALLLFGLLNQMTRASWRSGFVAALFALHPLHVESVAWVAERKDVLSAFFWMLTMCAYVRYVEQPNRMRYCVTVGLYAMGLMAKPTLVTLPFVLLLLDYWPLGRTRWAQSVTGRKAERPLSHLVREKLPFAALAAAVCVATVWSQRSGGAVASLEVLPLASRMANAVVSYMRYMGKALWPVELAVLYPYQRWPWTTVVAAGAAWAGISGWAIWRAPRAPYFIVGWLWYVGTLVPVIGLVQAGSQSMADRYTYISLIGLFVMAAWAVPWDGVERGVWRTGVVIAAAALLAVCAVLARWQVACWENSETLFRHTLSATKNNVLAHYNLGQALRERGKFGEAIAEYREAVRLQPDYAAAHNNLGLALARLDKGQEAMTEYREALRINPRSAMAHNNLGLALVDLGKTEEAMAEYHEALQIEPESLNARNNLGLALARVGRMEEAVAEYRKALQIDPGCVEAHNNLGNTLARQGQFTAAEAEYREAVRSNPRHAQSHVNLGLALARVGKTEEAMAEYREALRIDPRSWEAHNDLGIVLANQGSLSEAAAEFAAAARIRPDDADAHNNWGNILYLQGKLAEAVARYREAARLRPDWPLPLNRLAWLLATADDARVRNGGEAVQWAERLCEWTGQRQAEAVMVLAAAYAEAGRFAEAVPTARKALELARDSGQGEMAARIEGQLKLYQAGRPCREASVATPR